MSSSLTLRQDISQLNSLKCFLHRKNNSTSFNISTIKAMSNHKDSKSNKNIITSSILDSLNELKNNCNIRSQQSYITNSTSTNIYSIKKPRYLNDRKSYFSHSTQKNNQSKYYLTPRITFTDFKLNDLKCKSKSHFLYKTNNNINSDNNKLNNFNQKLINKNINNKNDTIYNNIINYTSPEKFRNTFFTTFGKKDNNNLNQGQLGKFKNETNDLIKGYYINHLLKHKKNNITEAHEKIIERIDLDKHSNDYTQKIMNLFSNDFIEYTNYLKEIIEKEKTTSEKLAWNVYLLKQDIYILELKIGKLLIRLDKYVDMKEAVYKLKLFDKIHKGISPLELDKINSNFCTKMQTEYEINKNKKKFFLNIRDMKLSVDVLDNDLLENDENFFKLIKNTNFDDFTKITQNFDKYIRKQIKLDKEINEYNMILKNTIEENERYISENREIYLMDLNRMTVIYPQKIQNLKEKNKILNNTLNFTQKKIAKEKNILITKMKIKINNIYNILKKYNYINNEEDLQLISLNYGRENELKKIISKLAIIEKKIIYVTGEIKVELMNCTPEQKNIVSKNIKNLTISNEKRRKIFFLQKQRLETEKKLYSRINKFRILLRNKEDYYKHNIKKNKNLNK